MLCEKYLVHFPAEKLKRDFDKAFGPPWNVVVGECYTCDIDYDFGFLYQFLYGPVAVLAWRVRFFLIKNISTRRNFFLQYLNSDFLFYVGWSGSVSTKQANIMKVVQS